MKEEGIVKNKISVTVINDNMLEINVIKYNLVIHPMKFNFFLTGNAECICEEMACC